MIPTEQLSEQAAVTDWPARLLLVLLTLAVVAALFLLLRRGWRARERRQGMELPDVSPAVLEAAADSVATTGSYIGTIRAGQLLERINAGGLRSLSDVIVLPEGILIDRVDDRPLFMAQDSIGAVSISAGMLQRHFGGHGLLMIDWMWGDVPVTTGLWFTDPADQAIVRQRIERTHVEGVS